MLVKEAESLNMIIDLSHLSDEGVDDVLSITSCPLIASHSNARAVAHNNRNLKDEHLKEIARRGGVVGLNACSIINADTGGTADRRQMLAHLDYMIEVMGEQHVGFGFDFLRSLLKEQFRTRLIPDAGVSFRHSLRRSCGHSGFLAEYERT